MDILCVWGIENRFKNFWGQIKFFIRKLRASLVDGEATNRGRKAPVNRWQSPRIKGEARVEGAKRWAPPQKFFQKSNLKPFILVHIWAKDLKQMVTCLVWDNVKLPTFIKKSIINIWCWGNCLILLKFNMVTLVGVWGTQSPRSWSLLENEVVIQVFLVHIFFQGGGVKILGELFPRNV